VTVIKNSTLLAATLWLFIVLGRYAIAQAPLGQTPLAAAPTPSGGMYCGAEPLAAFCSAVRR
jgi:hypothetical protein